MRTIALLTDFGTRDPYVASMKGVIASHCDARIEDLSHEIAPHDVWEAAWFLRTCAAWWPEGTIFVCVVDPGVGTPRKIVAAEAKGRVFLAPDNGLLTFIDVERARSVENESLFLPAGSTTFHGRDRFAPVAAALATTTRFEEVGPPLHHPMLLDYEPAQYGDVVRGTIVSVDRFGNCITDVERHRLGSAPVSLRAGDVSVTRLSRTYSGDGPFMIVGSSGLIEISMAAQNAAAALRLRRGDRVEITTS